MKVLVVEDDAAVAEMLKQGLMAESHTVEVTADGADGSFLGRSYQFDAIILDYSLPKKDGLTVCRDIRTSGKQTPIIFLSVMGDTDIKVKAFECGADDYMTKPFSFNELSARLKVVTRRHQGTVSEYLEVDDLRLSTETQRVERAGKIIHLTRKEFNLLEYLMRHAGIIMSRTLIMEQVWTAESDPLSNTVEAHIRNVRKKIHIEGLPDLLLNVAGRGYVIDLPQNIGKFK